MLLSKKYYTRVYGTVMECVMEVKRVIVGVYNK